MRVNSEGNVGIGATAPSAALHVSSGEKTASNILAKFSTTEEEGGQLFYIENVDNTGINIQSTENNIGNNNLVLNRYGGNVGIGVTSPGAKLEVNTDIDITANPDSKGLRLKESHGDWLLSLGVENVTNEGFAIRDVSQGTYPFVIREETGNVGIGTTSPGYELDVEGQINSDAERIGEYEKFDAGNVSASGSATQERAIATFAMNEYHWSSTVGFFVEAHSNYFDTGYNKYYVEVGYYGMPDIFRVQSIGDRDNNFNLRLEKDDGNTLSPRATGNICTGELNESYTEYYGYERYDCKVHQYTLYAQAENHTNWNVTIASGGMNLFYGDATSEGYVGITKDSAHQEVTANTNDLDNVIYLGRDNVGINTFVPDAKLDVNGAAHLRSSLTMDSFIIGDEMSGITAANQLESLTIDGDKYLIATNVSSINIYSVSGSNLTKGESLYPVPNNETIHNAKTFVMGDQTYLSVAIEGNQLSQVYEWDATNKTFVALASSAGLLRVDAKDIEPFAIGNETYLAIAEIGDQAVIYRWTGSTFTAAGQWAYTNIQDIHDFQYIEIDDRNLLAFSADYLDDNGNNLSRLYIFEYDEGTQAFDFDAPLQTLSRGSTIERIQTFVRDEQTYIALAYDNSIALYQWNGTDAFFRYTWLTSNNASGAHYFTRGSDDYLLTTGIDYTSRIFRWVHDRLEHVQSFGGGSYDTEDAISINNGKTFILAHNAKIPIQYDWNNNLYVSPSNGRVGVGTSGSKTKLHVSSAEDYPLTLDTAAVDHGKTGIQFSTTGANTQWGYLSYSHLDVESYGGNASFHTSSDQPITNFIHHGGDFYVPDGNIGIGTTSPAAKLEVAGSGTRLSGTVYTSSFSQSILGWSNETKFLSEVNVGDYILFSDGQSGIVTAVNSDNSLKIDKSIYLSSGTTATVVSKPAIIVPQNAGFVGIGTSTPSALLEVAGTALATSWDNTSDSRLKTAVETIPSALEKILSLRGVTFEWKQEEFPERNFTEGTQIGLIAQEVEEVFPELVSQGEYKAVSYANLVSPLIEAVKELHALYQGHADRLAALEAQNAEQDNHIAHQDERIAHQDELIVQLEVRLAALEAAQ